VSDLTLDDLGLPAELTAVIDPAQAERVAATLGRRPPETGERLPTLWHWAWFTPVVPTAGLGDDGHPHVASPRLAAYPRRMWGAGSVTWDGDLIVGDAATRRTSIAAVKETTGQSGPLVIVTLAHEYAQGGQVKVRETQQIVYRTPGEPVPLPTRSVVLPAPEGGWREVWVPEPALLFRFSAVTFNAHRIHYDERYAREVEGYPDRVVHGPLISLVMADFAERCSGRHLTRWSFRAAAPLFCGAAVTLTAAVAEEAGNVEVVRNDGVAAVRAELALRPAT
jgi:hydroxyacyl-ACP dehydratase HTD2-like protein with hotdog domain